MSTRQVQAPKRSQAISPAAVSIVSACAPVWPRQPVGDAARAVAAGAGLAAVVVVDAHEGGARGDRAGR